MRAPPPTGATGRRRLPELFRGVQVRRILGVAAGAASAHGIILLASPILTRIYSPADFGVYSFFFAALGFLAPVATLRYELAIPLPRSEGAARATALLGVLASLALAGLTAAALGAARWFGLPPLDRISTAFLVGLPAGIAAAGVYQVATYFAVRHERFRAIAVARGWLGLGTSTAQVSLGLVGLGPAGLVFGDVGGRLTSAAALLAGLRNSIGGGIRRFSVRTLRRRAWALRGFPFLSAPAVVLNSLGLYLPLVAVGHHYGAAAAGWLFLAQRAIGLPATLLSSATSQVYIAELTRTGRADRVPVYRRTLARLAALGAAPFLLAALLSPFLFPPLFGAEWATAGRLAMILAPFYFFQLLSGATITTLDVMMLHGARFLREATFLALTVAVFALPFARSMDLSVLVGLYSGVGCLFYVGSILFVRLLMGRGPK